VVGGVNVAQHLADGPQLLGGNGGLHALQLRHHLLQLDLDRVQRLLDRGCLLNSANTQAMLSGLVGGAPTAGPGHHHMGRGYLCAYLLALLRLATTHVRKATEVVHQLLDVVEHGLGTCVVAWGLGAQSFFPAQNGAREPQHRQARI
jgi:hypothetical protein